MMQKVLTLTYYSQNFCCFFADLIAVALHGPDGKAALIEEYHADAKANDRECLPLILGSDEPKDKDGWMLSHYAIDEMPLSELKENRND